ncbi:MAG TPA: UDP-N-acetylmuramoyl-L-alanine--D-glutamate ligase [Rudaea sp.]|nr:UDP-N-acetylmuramoyl-L-alanine--D-glutamate ligase [Rudaea sp.]
MKLADLERARVAVWGYGREGRAALATLRQRFPDKPLVLFCSEDEKVQVTVDANLRLVAGLVDAQALSPFDIVIKSPGISPYKSPVPEAIENGVHFTSGTALWFAENPHARVIGVTGTKGKSTTSALIAHLARALGVRTALAGNIGLPLLDLLGQRADRWVVELSSFQTSEAGPLDVGVITNLYEEHLDWHGTPARYAADKLKLADVARRLVVNAMHPDLLARTVTHSRRTTFGDAAGWHVRDAAIWRGDKYVLPLAEIPLSGEHNALNVCAALVAIECAGLDAIAAARHVANFKPLPHRLQSLGVRDGIEYVNDSISTTPHATIEALRSLHGRAVTVLVGGFDRGVDWNPFVEYVAKYPPHGIVAMGANGPRIGAALASKGYDVAQAATLAEAVAIARKLTSAGGTILLSPGAPSFDQFKDYAERGREFARQAGFDPAGIAQIEGLGIA